MKKALLTLIICGFSATCLFPQQYSTTNLGRITQSDFTVPEVLADMDVPAYVIFEEGTYYFGEELDGLHFNKAHYIKIHVVKQAGIEYAEFEIPYYSSSTALDKIDIEGYTYNLNSNNELVRTPLNKNSIFDEKSSDNIYVKKIAMPDVGEGSVIELYYSHNTRYFVMQPWYFQKAIPVLYSQLRYQETPSFKYDLILRGAEKYDIYNVNDQHSAVGQSSVPNGAFKTDSFDFNSVARQLNTYTYGMVNLRAFEEEDFVLNAIDYRVAVYPQLAAILNSNGSSEVRTYTTNWGSLRNDYLSDADFGKYINSSARRAKKILEDISLGTGDTEKIEAIVRYVKNNYTWNGRNIELAEGSLSAFLRSKTGNAGNINLFLTGMLQAAGIESYPVILSKKSHGTINKEYPYRDLFNFVVVMAKADGKTYYLDATDTYTPFNMVSPNCINTEGFVIKPGAEEWVMITNPHPSVNFATVTLTIDPESGIISGDAVETSSGINGILRKKWYGGDQEKLEAMFEDYENFTLKDASTENYNKTEQPFKIKYTFESELDEPMADKIFIEPMANIAPKDNIFKETEPRQYPIDMVSRSMDGYNISIPIPEGYTVEYLPEFTNVDSREISMIYAAGTDGDTININAQFTFKSAVYPAADYETLKKYYGDMIAKFSDNIVLKKTE